MRTLVLAGNGPVLNRGCQAIEEATLGILRRAIDCPRFVIAPIGVDSDDLESDSDCVRVKHRVWGSERLSAEWFAKNAAIRVAPRWAGRRLFRFDALDPYMEESRGFLQLGGDNFSLDYGGPEPFLALNEYALKRRVPVVLWGASVGPFSAEPRFEPHAIRELSRVSLILAREQMTADYLSSRGLGRIVERAADPAFALAAVQPRSDVVDPSALCAAIGFNISPLYERYTGKRGQWPSRVADVVEAIARATGRPMVFVPHVVVSAESDYTLLHQVADEIAGRGLRRPLVLPADLTASEIKWCIAKCDVFVGARTHATIAALSSGVPTISLAYSMKARGINRDLFGHDRFVCTAREFRPETVSAKVLGALEECDEVRDHLRTALPPIFALAEGAGALTSQVLGLDA